MSLSLNIKRYREDHNISQECMGFRLHMDQSAYCRLEKRCDACAKRLPQIAEALETTPDVLRTYHNHQTEATGDSPVLLPDEGEPATELMLLTKDEIIKWQNDEIMFLRQQVSYQQAVWHQYCGGGQHRSEPEPGA